ncbi:hypothetical protein CPB86DRAFT_480537 [Serendipita vermifera]|nr:hypothetical protein CPB86DRAFT_480537 [Serendipita vermifera]
MRGWGRFPFSDTRNPSPTAANVYKKEPGSSLSDPPPLVGTSEESNSGLTYQTMRHNLIGAAKVVKTSQIHNEYRLGMGRSVPQTRSTVDLTPTKSSLRTIFKVHIKWSMSTEVPLEKFSFPDYDISKAAQQLGHLKVESCSAPPNDPSH